MTGSAISEKIFEGLKKNEKIWLPNHVTGDIMKQILGTFYP